MSSGGTEHHHNADEILLSYLDRELSDSERGEIERHLGECWSCRTRAAEIEQSIHIAARAIEDENSRSGDEIKLALQEFLRRRKEFEFQRRPPFLARCALSARSWPPIPVAFAAAVATVIAIVLIGFHAPREQRPEAVLAQAKASEETLCRSPRPSHQVLRVEGRTSSEAAARAFGTLEIWSDSAAGGRYASSWRDARNTLRHAVWKPAAATRYAYDPDARRAVPCSQPVETTHIIDGLRNAADLASLEHAFLQWVRSRTWTVVSFTEEWAAFVERGGVHVVIQRLREGPRNLWRLSASRVDRDRTFEMILQVDTETYLPRVQALRVAAGGRVAELTMTVDGWHLVSFPDLGSAVFAPAPSIPRLDWPQAPVSPPALFTHPVAPARAPLPEWALADLEFRVRAALHDALQCVDVSVGREPGAGIVVRPLFSDGPTPAALKRTLERIEGSDYVRIAPRAEDVTGGTSHSATILKHARTMREIAASAHQTVALSPPQERQLARLFADHRRALRLEMAHLTVRLLNCGKITDAPVLALLTENIADFATGSHFLESEATRAVLLKIDTDTAGLADSENPDPHTTARLIRVLTALDSDLSSLEYLMRAGSIQASRESAVGP